MARLFQSSTSTSLPSGTQGQVLAYNGTSFVAVKGAHVLAASYGVTTGGTAAANATALQAAIDANPGLPVVLPSGTVNYSTSLSLKAESILWGSSVMGGTSAGASVLNYQGADATHAIQMASPSSDPNGVWLKGFRLTDGRTTPTSGDGIHIERAKNGVIIEQVLSSFAQVAGAGIGIYVGALSGHTSEGPVIRNCWAFGGQYGIMLERIDNWFEISDIWTDSHNTGKQTAGVYLGTMVQGQVSGKVRNVKLETTTGCHLLQVDAACSAGIVADNLTMLSSNDTIGSGGDVINYAATTGRIEWRAVGCAPVTGGVCATNLINDTVTSSNYGTAAKRGPISSVDGINRLAAQPGYASKTHGATIVNSSGVAAQNVVVWRAPSACIVRALKGWRVAGTGATINAGKGTTATPTNPLMSSDLSLTSTEQWMDGGTIQNALFVAGDPLIVQVVSVAGTPTQVGVQVEFSVI